MCSGGGGGGGVLGGLVGLCTPPQAPSRSPDFTPNSSPGIKAMFDDVLIGMNGMELYSPSSNITYKSAQDLDRDHRAVPVTLCNNVSAVCWHLHIPITHCHLLEKSQQYH